jgi:FkbM family methyltransferase
MLVPKRVTTTLDSLGLSSNSGIRYRINQHISWRRQVNSLKQIEPLRSYGQFGEDAMLQSLLPTTTGFYIDIGSGHPILGSNTYALYEQGWRGILVDPVRANVELSQRVRSEGKSIHAAIGLSDSEVINFIEFETYQYSTTSESRATEVSALGHKVTARYSVKILPLKQILPTEIPAGSSVMSIDVEGEEMSVLLSNDWETFRPDFVLIEDLTPPMQKSTSVSEFLRSKNYELIGIAGVTCLYKRLD